ncbi:MAG: hypothetical protein AAGJ93_16810 [Bacteroidota bacterium]
MKEELTEKDSLEVIQNMISMAKGSVVSNQFYFVLWGWVLIIINLFDYVATAFFEFPYAKMAWFICFPLGIYTGIHANRMAKKRPFKTHMDDLFLYMWMGFFIIIVIIVGAGGKINYYINPMIVLVTSLPTLVTGLVIKFKPLIIGASSFWIFAAIAFNLPYEYHSLIGAVALFCGYLVPGYMLKRKTKHESV